MRERGKREGGREVQWANIVNAKKGGRGKGYRKWSIGLIRSFLVITETRKTRYKVGRSKVGPGRKRGKKVDNALKADLGTC